MAQSGVFVVNVSVVLKADMWTSTTVCIPAARLALSACCQCAVAAGSPPMPPQYCSEDVELLAVPTSSRVMLAITGLGCSVQVEHDMLQSVILLLLIVRLLHKLSFQPHISVITTTLQRAAPDLAAFLGAFQACQEILFADFVLRFTLAYCWFDAFQSLSVLSSFLFVVCFRTLHLRICGRKV